MNAGLEDLFFQEIWSRVATKSKYPAQEIEDYALVHFPPLLPLYETSRMMRARTNPKHTQSESAINPQSNSVQTAVQSSLMNMSSKPPDQAARDACRQEVMGVFPDISPEYLEEIVEKYTYNTVQSIKHIIDLAESGTRYPRRQKRKRVAKRKRNENEDIEEEMQDMKRDYVNDQRKAYIPSPQEKRRMCVRSHELRIHAISSDK
jgi:hypothetical protein